MAKTKITMFLDPDLIEWLDQNRDEETSRSAYLRILIRKDMKSKARRKTNKLTSTVSDPFTFFTISPDLIPEDLKEYADLLIEWWPIRKKKGASCTQSVANRIFNTLRSFPSQDRKEALENAITGGWKNIYELKKGYKPEEPKNNHPAQRVFTAERGFE
jgi:hypothetical protein